MALSPLRVYLLMGLLAHKLLWEVLKRRPIAGSPRPTLSLRVAAIKALKLGILLAIIVQSVVPDFLPIAAGARDLRIAGAALFTLGLLTAIAARLQLGDNWSDIETARVRDEHVLICTGVYKYVRHPIYAGDLALLLGLELALNSWLALAVLPLAVAVYRRAVREEKRLIEYVPGYAHYCGRSKRFVPFLL